MASSKLASLLILVGAIAVANPANASDYRDLCSSARGACEYTGPDAPRLDIDVCLGAQGELTVKTGDCSAGAYPYHLSFGEVIDASIGTVVAYEPLNLACDRPGVCIDDPPPPGASEFPICCEWGLCVPLGDVPCNSLNSFAYLCDSGVTNEDGTVTCFEGEQI